MAEGGYEIVCNGCRASVSSLAERCPDCGSRLLGAPEPSPMITMSAASHPQAAGSSGLASALTLPVTRVGPSSLYKAAAMDFAGFWIRLLAYVIDVVVLFILLVLADLAIRLAVDPVAFVLAIATLLYFPAMESSRGQGTVGKRVCGLIVTDSHMRRISFARALGRLGARVIVSALTFGIGYLMVAFTDRKRGLHDMLAGTLVLHR